MLTLACPRCPATVHTCLAHRGQAKELWQLAHTAHGAPLEAPGDPAAACSVCDAFSRLAVEEARGALRATGGRWFTVEWVKLDGTRRVLTGRLGVRKYVKGTGSPQSGEYLIVWDSRKREYRKVRLATVETVRCGRLRWQRKVAG